EFGKPTSLPDFSSYLEVNTLSSTPVGQYTLKISGTGGGVTNTIHIPLSVSVPPPVGGTIVPVEKLAILAPFALIAAIIIGSIAAGIVYFRRNWIRGKQIPSLSEYHTRAQTGNRHVTKSPSVITICT